MDKVYRQALIAAVYGESATYHVADDPLAKDAANTVRRLRDQLSAAIARAEAAEREVADADEDMHALCDQLAEANGESVVSGPADGIARLAAERDDLAVKNARLRDLLRQCRPHVESERDDTLMVFVNDALAQPGSEDAP